MNLRYFTMISSLSALAVGGALLAPMRARASEQGVEELTRGPVHEAFAATVSFDPEPGMLVRTAPPAMIEEIPPEQRLEGDNVSWIPGYWGWDEEQNDFIWISGVWRNLPPDRQWVPGYWAEVDSQWQWTSGYWADEAVQEVAYLPKPPKSIESGPNVKAPSRNHIWISGTWVDQDDRYAWRPGYWEQGQENWTWIPAHYQWTRRGYIFIDGYWDYDVDRRGVVFAPVRFQRGYYDRPDFSYTPLMVISLNVFANHLFVRPRYGHYYFGDYYAPRYRNEGYYTQFSYRSGRSGYDPIYAQSRWEHRDDRGWEQARRENYDYYRDNQDARPPQTWAAMQTRPVDRRGGKRDNYQFAAPLNQYVSSPTSGQRFAAVSPEIRSRTVEQRQQVREFGKGRQQLESRSSVQTAQGAEKGLRVNREKIAKSPVVAKRADQLSGREAPPKRLEPKASEARGGKGAVQNDNAGNGPGGAKQFRQSNPEARGGNSRAEENRGKSAGPNVKPNENPAGRPGQGPGSNSKRKQESDSKPAVQPEGRSAPKADMNQGGKPATDPRGRKNESEQQQKQAQAPERKPQPFQKVEPKPDRKPESQPMRQQQPEQRQKAEPKPDRKPESQPMRQQQPEQRQKVEPKPDRKPELQPMRQQQPEQRQKAEPKPDRKPESQPMRQQQPEQRQKVAPQPTQRPPRAVEPQKQPAVQPQQNRPENPANVPPRAKKKPGEEDPDSKKGR